MNLDENAPNSTSSQQVTFLMESFTRANQRYVGEGLVLGVELTDQILKA
jgi:hypothetical protein